MLRRAIVAALLVLGAAAVCAAGAQATTYCVSAPGCVGTASPDVQSALNSAASVAGKDTVRIGPGTFTGPFSYNSNSGSVLVRGSGPDKTTLTANIDPQSFAKWVINAGGSGADVDHLTVTLPSGSGWKGIQTGANVIDDVVIDGTPSGPVPATGIDVSSGAKISNADISFPSSGFGIQVTGGDALTVVRDSAISAISGIQANPGTNLDVRRITVENALVGVNSAGATIAIDDSVLRVTGTGSGGLVSGCTTGSDAAVAGDHLTIIGPGGTGFLTATQCSSGGRTATLRLRNSLLRGGGSPLQRLGNGGTAKAIVRYTSLRTANITQSGAGTTTLENTLNIDPLFVSASDAHLRAGSPAINAGDPAAGGPATDRDGKPRVVGGRRDLGAYERQTP